jgi:hypothetical protein
MPGRISLNAAAVSLIAICILSAAMLVAVTSSDHPAVVRAASMTTAPAAGTIEQLPASASKPHPIEPRPTDEQFADSAAATSSTGAAPVAVKPVTITGCLERDGASFRLVDTNGSQAPKSRSWKSGFLKKGNAAVAVVDSSKRLNLTRHVNERVGVTGVLSGHSMQARSISRVAAKCS